ncbi:MAG: hypothetical protein U0930_02720 [Pirellulales bacterium]
MSGQRPPRWRGERPNRNNRPPRPSSVPPQTEQRMRELDAEHEPLSLAEEISRESRHDQVAGSGSRSRTPAAESQATFAELQKLTDEQLLEVSKQEDVQSAGLNRRELIFQIIKARLKHNGLMFGEGTLEILPDGFGFLRSSKHHYISCPDDIYVSPSQIRRFGLQTGSTVAGQIRPPKENERYFALLRVEAINFHDPDQRNKAKPFEELTPLHPNQRIMMETTADVIEPRR